MQDNENGCFITILLILGLLLGVGYQEGASSSVTVLEMDGAPEGIVYIADPHLHEGNLPQVQETIDRINALHPSLVLIGGDFTRGADADIALQQVWGRIDAPVYSVLGNHDYRTGMSPEENLQKIKAVAGARLWSGQYNLSALNDGSADREYADRIAAVLEESGVHVLRNERVNLTVDGKDVLIVGVDDGWAGMAAPPELPPADAFTIYLIHEPDCRGDWDADLVLSGHTHGGQVIPPGLDRLLPGDRFRLSGRIDEDDRVTYITRGLSTSSSRFTFRLFASPEIVVIGPPGYHPGA